MTRRDGLAPDNVFVERGFAGYASNDFRSCMGPSGFLNRYVSLASSGPTSLPLPKYGPTGGDHFIYKTQSIALLLWEDIFDCSYQGFMGSFNDYSMQIVISIRSTDCHSCRMIKVKVRTNKLCYFLFGAKIELYNAMSRDPTANDAKEAAGIDQTTEPRER